MSYYFSKVLLLTFDQALTRTVTGSKEGFGVLTEINIQETITPFPPKN